MHKKVIFDRIDLKLLAALQSDSSATNADLAERVGLSHTQISRRRSALEAQGVIEGYSATLNADALGLKLMVFIHVSLDTHNRNNAQHFRKLVNQNANIIEAHALTGEADYLIKLIVMDLAELAHVVNEVLLPHPAVARVRSEIVLQTLKKTSSLPLHKL
jgi:DNA-binding Lrp family transcriptional regulator